MRFSLRTFLLSTAFAAIVVGGFCTGWRVTYDLAEIPQLWFAATAFNHVRSMAATFWMWLPFIFVAFAAGAKRLTVRLVIVFALCEASAIGLLPLERRLVEFVYSDAVPPVAAP